MDDRRFDDAARMLARGNTRRDVIGFAARGAASSLLGLVFVRKVAAQPGCREEGHPCEGNQTCCGDLACVASGPGAAKRCTARCVDNCPEDERVVLIVSDIDVEADCSYSGEMQRTTCTFTADSGGAGVASIAVPESVLCTEVVGGDFEEVDLGANVRPKGKAKGLKSKKKKDKGAVVTLELAGQVTIAATATYWCETEQAVLIPVTGPGLSCPEAEATPPSDVTDSTGAVVVQTYSCNVAAGSEDVDWFDVCGAPTVEVTFRLSRQEEEGWAEVATQTTDTEGLCRFGQLPPGTYRLEQTEAAWCHAESDSVDEQGDVVVNAGAFATIWAFYCDEAK